jgi:hypothetical protein
MKARRTLKWVVALVFLTGAGIGSAWAGGYHGHGHYGHGHSSFGVVVGVPWGPWPYSSPYYYPPYPPVVIERAPPVYVEQAAPPPQTAQAGYWHYCAAAKAYYPYVNECPGGWQRVAPQPPSQP